MKLTPRLSPMRILIIAYAIGLVVLFALAVSENESGTARLVPEFALPQVSGVDVPGISSDNLKEGDFVLVNVWASWCAPCRVEHPYLVKLAQEGRVRVVGIAYKDSDANIRRFLARFDNPFERLGHDPDGHVVLNWGVYGVPESFLVSGTGEILFRHFGPLTDAIIAAEITPRISGLAQ